MDVEATYKGKKVPCVFVEGEYVLPFDTNSLFGPQGIDDIQANDFVINGKTPRQVAIEGDKVIALL